jgi:diacylglycerol kinase family enzyme
MGLPDDIEQAVEVALGGERRVLDVGSFNGEKFAVMAGVGFDASMIRGAGAGALKERLGRAAYLWSGSKSLGADPFHARIRTDGVTWYDGKASCILLGNVGKLFGGVEVFEDVRLDDGKLEVGLVTAEGLFEWSRLLARAAAGRPDKSAFARTTKAHSVKVTLSRKVRYELDGGDRTRVSAFKAKSKRAAVTLCVPPAGPRSTPAR